MRSKNFQDTIGGKGLTWLLGRALGVVIFEGFLHYLSALTHFQQSYFKETVPVLNSASMLLEAICQLREAPVVHWLGDNDVVGERALHLLRQLLPGKVRAHNELYRGYKNFNDFLTKTPPSKLLPSSGPSRASLAKRRPTGSGWYSTSAPRARPSQPAKSACAPSITRPTMLRVWNTCACCATAWATNWPIIESASAPTAGSIRFSNGRALLTRNSCCPMRLPHLDHRIHLHCGKAGQLATPSSGCSASS